METCPWRQKIEESHPKKIKELFSIARFCKGNSLKFSFPKNISKLHTLGNNVEQVRSVLFIPNTETDREICYTLVYSPDACSKQSYTGLQAETTSQESETQSGSPTLVSRTQPLELSATLARVFISRKLESRELDSNLGIPIGDADISIYLNCYINSFQLFSFSFHCPFSDFSARSGSILL